MILLPGKPYPLGATVSDEGINFAVFSAHATAVELCLFDRATDHRECLSFGLKERSGSIWHGFIKGAKEGALYAYRVDGPFEPTQGHRFNRNKLLLDPYAKDLARPAVWNDCLLGYLERDDTSFNDQDSAPFAAIARARRSTHRADSWPAKLDIHWKDSLIYETHVKGISKRHPDVDPLIRGTYLGLCSEPILRHLKELGITAVQLQPVQLKMSEKNLFDAGLTNYWGYSPINYFIPEPSYALNPEQAISEFQLMVRTIHEAGMEVILDVVYNHTAEGNRFGPTLSYRGFDNASYYRKSAFEPRFLEDYTGTGNTLDANHPMVLRLIADSLRYWATEMGVDGFRFDLATSLAREDYSVDMEAPFLTSLQQDPVLSKLKLIAEPWDLGPNGYQVGSFPSPWVEWNGTYRDSVRQFWRGDQGQAGALATRLAGSSDLFGKRRPNASVNFVTAHDGFTLEDLVSYEDKHNKANLEQNKDGHEPNFSRNWGVEGPSDDPDIEARRLSIKRALFSTLMLSQGVPMVLGGDELERTQQGNNNAYCQDNELTWFDWNLDKTGHSWLQFCRDVIAFRKEHPTFFRRHFFNGGAPGTAGEQVIWWHPDGRRMESHEWQTPEITMLGLILPGNRLDDVDDEGRPLQDDTFLVIFNPAEEAAGFVLPSWGGSWTSCAPFSDVSEFSAGNQISIKALSVWVLRADQHP
ncbi:MAG: glycogen debranching protein GlgX [Bacteroidetes bacterium]|nr:glycogen debranching protein GlgX [Bacteroidota bacterium]